MTKQVRPIEIEDNENCNGWVACKSEYLEGVSPQNIHVLEAGLYQDKDGNWHANANEQRKTCCGKNKLKQGSWEFVEHSQGIMQNQFLLSSVEKELALWQLAE